MTTGSSARLPIYFAQKYSATAQIAVEYRMLVWRGKCNGGMNDVQDDAGKRSAGRGGRQCGCLVVHCRCLDYRHTLMEYHAMEWLIDASQIAGYWFMAVVLGCVLGARIGTWTAKRWEW